MSEEWGEGAIMHSEAVAQLRGEYIRELEAELARLREENKALGEQDEAYYQALRERDKLREVLKEIADSNHDDMCPNAYGTGPCRCHISIAENALKETT